MYAKDDASDDENEGPPAAQKDKKKDEDTAGDDYQMLFEVQAPCKNYGRTRGPRVIGPGLIILGSSGWTLPVLKLGEK
jgi:hypothetical protein